MSDNMTTEYPENEKLASFSAERMTISDFLEWLSSNGYWICRNGKFGFYSAPKRNDDLILEFLEIDQDKLEQERRHMLEALRAEQEPTCKHLKDLYAPHCTEIDCSNYAGRFAR